MSSLVLDAKHLNSCKMAAAELFLSHDFHKAPFEDFGLYVELNNLSSGEIINKVDSIFETLAVLNVVSVALQYKAHYSKEGELQAMIKEQTKDILNIKYGYNNLNLGQLYSALRSLNYQIEFERVQDVTAEFDEAYKFLQVLIDRLAHEIAGKSQGADSWFIYNF